MQWPRAVYRQSKISTQQVSACLVKTEMSKEGKLERKLLLPATYSRRQLISFWLLYCILRLLICVFGMRGDFPLLYAKGQTKLVCLQKVGQQETVSGICKTLESSECSCLGKTNGSIVWYTPIYMACYSCVDNNSHIQEACEQTVENDKACDLGPNTLEKR